MEESKVLTEELINSFGNYDSSRAGQAYRKAREGFNKKIIVLDDDPTGVQTVHGVNVYTQWDKESIREGLRDNNPMFFILTNSRGLTAAETKDLHQKIGERICAAAREEGVEYLLVSRGDSTLRGHFPLETQVLKETLEAEGSPEFDGEILCPFFPEGGRYTIHDIHYVKEGEMLVPAGLTEFAGDRTFGYKSSDLKKWVEEKTKGAYRSNDVVSITLEQLRSRNIASIEKTLYEVRDFNKVVVNAISYEDLQVFVTALLSCIKKGKHFMFRTAAAFTKVIGGISDKPLLTKEELLPEDSNPNGGLIIAGSHVNKTTAQLEKLKELSGISLIEFNVRLADNEALFAKEQRRVVLEAEQAMRQGMTAAVYTVRQRLKAQTDNPEDDLRLSVKISAGVTRIVKDLNIRPRFIIAKGGITSSDVGTKGLGVKKALVLGQLLPGVPVWRTNAESKFPDMCYVVFPGNVGEEDGLKKAVEAFHQERSSL